MKLLIQLVREILHLSGKIQGKVREFQTPMAVATMLNNASVRIGEILLLSGFFTSCFLVSTTSRSFSTGVHSLLDISSLSV